jgi:hypothetical protein
MKKYLYSIVFATLLLMSTTVVNASNEVYYKNKNNIEMTKTEYNNLLGLGFTKNQIERMDQEMFLENKDLIGTVLGEKEEYIKATTVARNGNKYTTFESITKEEAMKEKELQSQNPPSKGPAAGNYYDGMVSSNVILQTSKIVGISSTYMRYMTNTIWLTMPSERYYDIIGLGMESAKVQFGSNIVFRKDWTDGSGVDHHDTGCYPKYTNTGGLVIYQLPTGSLQSLEAILYFNVQKKNNVGTITSLYAGGNFAHATSNVNPNNLLNHISTNYGSGVIVDSTYSSYYYSNSAAVASFQGTW